MRAGTRTGGSKKIERGKKERRRKEKKGEGRWDLLQLFRRVFAELPLQLLEGLPVRLVLRSVAVPPEPIHFPVHVPVALTLTEGGVLARDRRGEQVQPAPGHEDK